ncbi:MAG: UDP-N-acetylmuramoylalanine--D-glutamate ligase [Candidatus Yonathbacteria bacterium RIFCSPHIGHO2_01_FULL_44_41]|uniref:UDP-N-acetylmuramoylalanine--D-glutamate ligase n=1 Tax=Candidatus Yonathbacteria bacterium RIFCSPHIGHO2_02_FULL_44_14 TaxID=1802724 RepID=A0A1G2S5T0_9BACT|nr:MAG: UDP-N-acetylmuramoylalanine--D-glutamate ligase [Candidatus Yonathbacteria bacterium RIFCSPHIGHO2_01_FULL_44_41]OHA80347.1 MAG: UDP-N-acetylmuramoylalanine--D-glutamate ligase [Candidatus Yonathbacteria bacterium RIFCSPHIGHO2_02_FULL_44_14]OHA80655.1 MAG: UDP-N-acetylmuramoylalanine--D-glutamate ligase [Candidatus Yonathbacteria bacterium RIFCSPLOWO2_01_FULL_43_20]
MNETSYETFFKGKKITMLGLGLLGRGVNVAKFLAELDAELIITDLKDSTALAPSLKQLTKFKNIRYVFGEHRFEDFKNCDMVIKAAGVPLDSPYIAEANKNKIPVEMDASLFAKFTPATIVGVTGTRGKSTVTHLIAHILERAYPKHVFVGGNVRGIATLPLLRKTKVGDIVVLELDSWQLQGFGEAKLSPNIAVFTNFLPDHLNYYKGDMRKYFDDKANIFKHQKEDEVLVLGEQLLKTQEGRSFLDAKRKGGPSWVVARKSIVPKSWKIKIPGEHNLANIACAILACKELDVPKDAIKKGVESFVGVPGRLELVCTIGGVKYYNDTTATTPDGNRAALEALGAKNKKNIILIAGGADKNLDYTDMAKFVHKTVKGLVLIEGVATEKLLAKIPKKTSYPVYIVDSMRDAVEAARDFARYGDTILLSPGAASFGVFKNEFDRGDQFVKLVKNI